MLLKHSRALSLVNLPLPAHLHQLASVTIEDPLLHPPPLPSTSEAEIQESQTLNDREVTVMVEFAEQAAFPDTGEKKSYCS